MPKEVSEITEGVAFSYSSENGQVAQSQPRVFRVVLESPTELIDIQQECGVRIGDELRPGAEIYCTSFDARYEGSSRMVLLCTFQFRNTPSADSSSGGADPKSQAPDVRPPSWSTSTSLVEEPLYAWRPRTAAYAWGGAEPATNPAGDIYDSVTRLQPIVTINVTAFQVNDPTRDSQYAGKVNDAEIKLGRLTMKPHTLMFRGVQSQPIVESWGGETFKGWSAQYEFLFKRNETEIRIGNQTVKVDLGWDVAIPQSGFNCKAFNPNAPGADDDIFGQPLKHGDEGSEFDGRIDFTNNQYSLPSQVAAGDKVRAMVKVFSYRGGGASQTPSASPIPLNDNGRPRKDTADPKVLVYGYAIQEEMDFNILGETRNLFTN